MIQVLNLDILSTDLHGIDAIVNSTNKKSPGIVGLDRKLYKAGGRQLKKEVMQAGLKKLKEGDVIITSAPNTEYVFALHTIFPRWKGPETREAMRNCYQNILYSALRKGIKSIVIPAMGTSHKDVPMPESARISVEEVQKFLEQTEDSMDIYFVLRNASEKRGYEFELKKRDIEYKSIQDQAAKVHEALEKEPEYRAMSKEDQEEKFKSELLNKFKETGIVYIDFIQNNPAVVIGAVSTAVKGMAKIINKKNK